MITAYDLIEKLDEKGIEIDPYNSEQEIKYDIFGDEKKAIVPLRSTFEIDVEVLAYILRGGRLEIILRNHHSHSVPTGRYGGTKYHEDGIRCSFEFRGNYNEAEIIEKAKEVLNEFYK